MKRLQVSSRKILVLTPALLVCVLGPPIAAQTGGIHTDGLFEFGDGVDPAAPGIADILGSEQAGPDWDDLFNADLTLRDSFDELGAAVPNGVPDFLDTWGVARSRRDVAFVTDAVGDASDPADDVGNAYVYTAFNDSLEMAIYVGVERLSTAASYLELELRRASLSIDEGGQPIGQSLPGDLKIRADFASGILASISIERMDWDPVTESNVWMPLENLPIGPEQSAEQCNAAGTVCTACNGVSIDGGAWPNYDAAGNVIGNLSPDTFLEIGINLGGLLGSDTFSNYYRSRFRSVKLSTPQDSTVGHFVRASKLTHLDGSEDANQ